MPTDLPLLAWRVLGLDRSTSPRNPNIWEYEPFKSVFNSVYDGHVNHLMMVQSKMKDDAKSVFIIPTVVKNRQVKLISLSTGSSLLSSPGKGEPGEVLARFLKGNM